MQKLYLTFAGVLVRNVVSEKQINAVLLFGVAERVAQITAHRLHDVVTLRRPRCRFSVCLDAMDQLRAAVLPIR